MSIQALNWAMSQDKILASPTKFVLLVLCNYANEDGQCYPSRETLAKKTGLSVPTIQRHLNWLVDHQFISRTPRRFDEKISTNVYQILSITLTLSPPTLVSETQDLSIRDDEKLSITLIPNTKAVKVDTKANTLKKKPAKKISDNDWIESLKKESIYSHIDFDRELRKAQMWIRDHPRRQFNKAFFRNWINNIEPPLNLPTMAPTQNGYIPKNEEERKVIEANRAMKAYRASNLYVQK